MGEHKTIESTKFIEFVKELGLALGYHVDTELSMKSSGSGAQAIDIAWFNDKSNDFPLMIFEVESTTNNAIINNPAKVFGKDSKTFEKPLFFFHIIIHSAASSEKYSDLLGLFGKYNYDIFRINNGEMNDLIVKIISQHRRIRNDVNLERVLNLILINNEVLKYVDLSNLLIVIEPVLHENQSYYIGQIYSNLATSHELFETEYVSFLERTLKKNSFRMLCYSEYDASIVAEAINIGLICNASSKVISDDTICNMLSDYQKRSGYMKTIDYLIGLNQDYDEFILDRVPFYLAVVFTLCQDNNISQEFIIEIAFDLIIKINFRDEYVSYHHISWFLLLAASNNRFYEKFEAIRKIVNQSGGINDHVLYSPLTFNNYENYGYVPNNGVNIQVPEITRYKEEIVNSLSEISTEFSLVGIANRCIASNCWEDELDYIIELGVDLAKTIVSTWK